LLAQLEISEGNFGGSVIRDTRATRAAQHHDSDRQLQLNFS
jgi:hypothetical protein